MNELAGALGTLTKNIWIDQNIGKTYQEWRNWSEYCENLPSRNELTGILGKTYQEWINWQEYWENLPRMIELTRILGEVNKNKWIDLSIGKTYQVNCPEYWESLPIKQINWPECWEHLPRTNKLTVTLGKFTKNE